MIPEGLRSIESESRRYSIEIWLFGSLLDRGTMTAADVDLAVIYESASTLRSFKTWLRFQPIGPIVDLTALTPSEAVESGFLKRAGATPLINWLNTSQEAKSPLPLFSERTLVRIPNER